MMAQTTDNHVTVLWARGALQDSSREFMVPIDSSMVTAIFTLSTDNRQAKMEVFGPSDRPLSSDSHADITDFTCGRYLILKNPSAGNYRVQLAGSGHFWLSVGGKSQIFLHSVEFVERGGRPGHEGMFPIQGEPLLGRPAALEASISGPAKQVTFEFVTPENESHQNFGLNTVHRDSDDQEFEGEVQLPAEPFRIVATGVDELGHPFRRVHEGLVNPTTIALAPVELPDLHAGRASILTFRLSNLGNADKFRLRAVCGKPWPTQLSSSEVSLGHGESTRITVEVSVPEGTPTNTGGDFVLSVSSENDRGIGNSFVRHFSIEQAVK